ncbi:hypothetical protein PXD56_00250 [Maribacter sp. SA7]|nr:hypothetical protein [Maribacter zhoushanensis]MDF4201363.1 hypothetical protein [Maribacter zhoushanensis]
MTRVNIDNQSKEPILAKALKLTIVIAAIGILLCILLMTFEL